MRPLLLAILASARMLRADDANTRYNVFGSVAFIRSGERTPVWRETSRSPASLTAFGAQQMFELGQNFRHRYIAESDQTSGFAVQHIANMSQNVLVPEQVFVQTLAEQYLVSSAQAFMQGLYPPFSSNSTQPGVRGDTTGKLANGQSPDYPLNGYQYPEIQVLSDLDPQSIYVSAATDNCPASNGSSNNYKFTNEFQQVQTAESRFYGDMDIRWFEGYAQDYDLDYANAYKIYDYLNYAYNHNKSTFDALSTNDSSHVDVLQRARWLADQDAYYRYGNASADMPGNTDQAMAGKTLSALILGQLQKIILNKSGKSTGNYWPMTLLFGDFEPLISFFSIANVDYLSRNFHAIPPFASAMMIELFTLSEDDAFPADENDLYIRFYFHNSTDGFSANGPPAYSMLRRGPSQLNVKWTDFQNEISKLMVNRLDDWCTACNARTVFCWGVDDNNSYVIELSSPAAKKPKVSPTVAGVIGAMVTLAVAGLLFAAAMLLGGVRLHRVERRGVKSALGGFKGSAKLASDPDLSLAKNGVAPAGIVGFGKTDGAGREGRVMHERVGSWELRQKETGGDLGDAERRESFEAIEAAMQRPVQPSESI